MNHIERVTKRRFIHTLFGSPVVTGKLFKDNDDLRFHIYKHNPILEALYDRALAKDSHGFWEIFKRVNQDDIVVVIHLFFLFLQANAPAKTLTWFKDELVEEKHHPYMQG
jgi:hypothetical protein